MDATAIIAKPISSDHSVEYPRSDTLSTPNTNLLNSSRYRIIRQLGEGGFGTVFLALDQELGREVAIKLPRLGMNRQLRDRLKAEAQAAARLRHPNIVSVFDFGQSSYGVFLVCEYVPGRTLQQCLNDAPLSRSQIIAWIISLAEALHYAADEGIVHRDIKPANIMIDSRQRAQLMDFGLALIISEQNPESTSKISGTPAYMSPEQARGEAITAASDQYALGAVLYEMLTHERPVTQGGIAAIQEIATRDAPQISLYKNFRRRFARLSSKQWSDNQIIVTPIAVN